MPNTLSQTEKDQLRYRIQSNTFVSAAEIANLVEKGYNEVEAKALLLDEIREYKQELFKQKMNKNKESELQNVMIGVLAVLAMIGPVFGVREPVWYIIAFIGAGVGGYFAAKTKPIAGIAASVVYAIVFPLAHNMYFADRTRFIRIEMVIPMIMAAIPAFIIYFILAKTIYANSDRESYDY